ncbi:MAG: FAD-binding protein [Saprospiraceae bacterium]|nr:FAD-binding protein [Saprospiraceae bacterium]MBK9629880.1 FAD-binding protein [Saprospiraceae bacterium]
MELDLALESALLDLKKNLNGELHWDALYQGMYATDASNYQIVPIAVGYPRVESDLIKLVHFANQNKVPLLARGGGTSLVGQTVGQAIVIDFTKYMHQLLELNVEESWAWVQPGLVRDELNEMLKPQGLHFAPDPATTSRAAVGGMIANNSSGTRSILYGKTLDHVLELRMLLADGTIIQCKNLSQTELENKIPSADADAYLYKGLFKIISNNREEIIEKFPKVMRRVGGYNLDEFLTNQWNLSRIFVGSEGTLGIILSAKINLVPNPKFQSVCVVHFDSFYDSIAHVSEMVKFGPAAVELLDEMLIERSRENLETKKYCGFINGNPKGALVVEFYGNDLEDATSKAQQMVEVLQSKKIGYAHPIFTEKRQIEEIFTVRKKGLGLLMGVKGKRKPIAFIEDAAVPLEHLAEYIMEVFEVCRKEETPVVAYAHASVGLLHVKPMLDLRDEKDIQRMKNISLKTLELVKKYKGSWSGEHGDGLARGPYNELFFGTRLYQAFKEVKDLFDPHQIFNPGKIIDSPPPDQNLRYGATYKDMEFQSMYHYRSEGSFQEAVHLCNGVGECRKTSGGTMCPSFRASLDEKESTRARANALRLALSGQMDVHGLDSDYLKEVLDLCLSCKACKSECPSNVDMSKLKSDVLYFQKTKKGFNTTDQLVSYQELLSSFASGSLAKLSNAVISSKTFRFLMEKLASIDRRRILPHFTSSPFTHKSQNSSDISLEEADVILFADCYTKNHDPNIGHAAQNLLEKCGYKVKIESGGCCQRPAMSRGLLEEARNKGLKTYSNLEKYLKAGKPILMTEPSCASAFHDDLHDLLEDPKWAVYKNQFYLIEEFLLKEKVEGNLKHPIQLKKGQHLFHGHCHQKAMFESSSLTRLLGENKEVHFDEIKSGCCGMAGMFGYEKNHYEISQQIGELSLFPRIRNSKSDSHIIAQGFSCRHQIEHFTGREAKHWVELVE